MHIQSQAERSKTLISKANMKKLVIYFVILVASLMLLGCGDKAKEPLALHNKLTTALEKEDFGFIFDSLTIESQKWALDFISGVSKYTPEVGEIAKTKSGRDLFVAACEKGYVISDVFKAEKISKIEVNGDEAIIIVEGDPFPSMMIRENGDWKFKPKFHVLYGMKEESESSGDKQPSISDSSGDSEPRPKTVNAPQQQTQSNNTEKSTPTPQSTIIGKPSKCGGVEVNVVTVDYSDSITGPLGNSNASDGATFVIVNWTYKNISSQPMNALNKPTMYLVSNENAKLKLDVGASATYATTLDNNEKILSDLNPGIKSDTSSVFEVAKELFDPFTWKITVEHQSSQSWFTIREKEKIPSSIANLISIGQSADFDGITTKIDSIQTKSNYGSLLIAHVQAIEGSIFVEINWSIENRSREIIDSKELEIFLVPEDGRKYVFHRPASAISFIDDGVLYQISQMIEPNTRLKRRDVFEVPKLKFKPSAWGLIVRRGDKDNWFSLIQNKPNQAQVEGTNGSAKPQSSGESVDSVVNAPTDDARAELELEKIKLERERIELEREKLKMQNQSNSGPSTNEPKIAADQIPAAATSTGSVTVPAMPGERYPETRLQLLGPADLMDLNLNDLRYAINEMYARHGVLFKNVEIAKGFANKEWFKPRPGVSFEEIEKEFSAIEADNLKLLGKERERKAASADLYELIDSESNLREGPGTNYPIVRKSRKGEVGEALSNKNGWMKLQFSDGSVAWAHEQNIKAAK